MCVRCAGASAAAVEGIRPDGVDRILVRWAHDDAPRSLVLDLKIRALRAAAIPLGRGIAELIRAQGCRSRVLTWVPGRSTENRVRGFDHAELIAREVARAVGIPCLPLLFRRLHGVDQTGLSRLERKRNLVGVFGSIPVDGWVGLVDDVVTSGATAEVCAHSLKAAGASGVELLAACRA